MSIRARNTYLTDGIAVNTAIRPTQISAMILICLLILSLQVKLLYASELAAEQNRYQADTIRIGVPQPDVIPFFWQDSEGHFQGIYADTLRLIADRLSLTLEFVPLSQARLKLYFEQGYIDIEAGVIADQSEDYPLQQASLFSRPFGIVNEVIIYRPELSFPVFILKDLKGRRVATVRGTSVPDTLIREDFNNQWQIAQRVHRGWNDIGLMKEATALFYQSSEQLNYIISLPYASSPVSLRIHQKRKDLLAPINRTITQLEQNGQLEALVCHYLCGALPDELVQSIQHR